MAEGKKRWAFFSSRTGERPVPYIINGNERPLRNSPLVIANPKEKKKVMATYNTRRNSKGQFVASRKASSTKKHHKKAAPQKNYMGIAPSFNPKPKRAASKPKTHHKPKKNPPSLRMPSLAGIALPSVSTTVGVAGGIAGPSIVKGLTTSLAPQFAQQNPTLLTILSYAAPPVIAYILGGKRAAGNVALGEAAVAGAKLMVQGLAAVGVTASLNGYTNPVPRAMLGRGVKGYLPPTPNSQLNGVTAFQNKTTRFKSRF